VAELERQIVSKIESLHFPEEFHKFALKWFRKDHDQDAQKREAIISSQQKAYRACVNKIDKLIDMRAGEEITGEQFAEKKSVLLKEKERFQELINDTDHNVNRSVEIAEDLFTFISDAVEKFNTGSIATRRRILSALGSNRSLMDKKLFVNLEETLVPVQKLSGEVDEINKRFEPHKNDMTQEDFERIYSQSSVVSTQQDSNQRPFA